MLLGKSYLQGRQDAGICFVSREKQKPQSAALKFVNQVVMTAITSRRPKVSVIVVNAPADSLHT